MLARAAYLLDGVNLKNLCYAYFFLAPVFLDRRDDTAIVITFAAGYLLSGLIVALAAAERLAAFQETVRVRGYSLILLAFLAMSYFSVLVNAPGNFGDPGLLFFKYGKLLFPMLTFFVMVNIWTRHDLPKLYTLLVAMGLLSFLLAVPDAIYTMRTRGNVLPRVGIILFDDPNKYAVFLNVLYGVMLPKFLSRIKEGKPWLGLGVFLVVLACVLVLTMSRSGFFAFALITAVCLMAARSRRLLAQSLVFLVPVGVLIFVAIVARYNAPDSAVMSDMGRLWTYAVALNTIQARPLTGIGFANVVEMYDLYGGMYLHLIGKPLDIHNAMLEIFAEQGVAGFVIYMLLVFIPVGILARRVLRISRTRYPVTEMAALNIPLVFFSYGLFYHHYLTNEYFWAYMTFTVIVLRESRGEGEELRFLPPKLV